MTYGIEVKNKNDSVIFGDKHLSIKKVASGYIDPATYKSSTGSIANGSSIVTLPAEATRHNSLVFARPELTEEYKQSFPDGLTHAPWALALTFVNDNQFTIIGPDSTISYYDGTHGDKGFSLRQSYQCWTDEGVKPARVYYEVWIQGLGSEEVDTHGLEVKDSNNDVIFDSNRTFFKTESTAKGSTRVYFDLTSSGPRINHSLSGEINIALLQRSKVSQELYMVCLNGTAHTNAIYLGGPEGPASPSNSASSGTKQSYETPQSPLVAYYRNFVEFHYAIEDDLFMAYPFIRMVGRLEKTQDVYVTTSENFYNDEPRYNEQVGVPACLLIGKSS